jgi:hypothetical protein
MTICNSLPPPVCCEHRVVGQEFLPDLPSVVHNQRISDRKEKRESPLCDHPTYWLRIHIGVTLSPGIYWRSPHSGEFKKAKFGAFSISPSPFFLALLAAAAVWLASYCDLI